MGTAIKKGDEEEGLGEVFWVRGREDE